MKRHSSAGASFVINVSSHPPPPLTSSKPKLIFPTARQSSARPGRKTHVRAAEYLPRPIRAPLRPPPVQWELRASRWPRYYQRASLSLAAESGVNLWEDGVESLMVLIKTTKNIIRAADFRGDCCGGRISPPTRLTHRHLLEFDRVLKFFF